MAVKAGNHRVWTHQPTRWGVTIGVLRLQLQTQGDQSILWRGANSILCVRYLPFSANKWISTDISQYPFKYYGLSVKYFVLITGIIIVKLNIVQHARYFCDVHSNTNAAVKRPNVNPSPGPNILALNFLQPDFSGRSPTFPRYSPLNTDALVPSDVPPSQNTYVCLFACEEPKNCLKVVKVTHALAGHIA